MTYAEQLKSPKWQKKRLEILERDNFTCTSCGSTEKQLHVHHGAYLGGLKLWEYDNRMLHTLCAGCHSDISDEIYETNVAIGEMEQNGDNYHMIRYISFNIRVLNDADRESIFNIINSSIDREFKIKFRENNGGLD